MSIAVDRHGGKSETVHVASADALARLVEDEANRSPEGVQLRIHRASSTYPTLVLSAREGVAVLHHLPEEGHPGFHSLGEPGAALLRTTFPAGTAVRVPNSHLVPLDRAVDAAIEFVVEPYLPPTCLAWFDCRL